MFSNEARNKVPTVRFCSRMLAIEPLSPQGPGKKLSLTSRSVCSTAAAARAMYCHGSVYRGPRMLREFAKQIYQDIQRSASGKMRERVGELRIEKGTGLVIPQNQLIGHPADLRSGGYVEGKLVLGQQGPGKSALVVADRGVARNSIRSDLHAANHLRRAGGSAASGVCPAPIP